MTRLSYNIITVSVFLVGAVAIMLVSQILIKEGIKHEWFPNSFARYKIIMTIVGISLSLFSLSYMFFAISYTEEILDNVTVVKILHRGSPGGYNDSFLLHVKDVDEKEKIFSMPFFFSKEFKKTVGSLNEGDNIKMSVNARTRHVYNVEIIPFHNDE